MATVAVRKVAVILARAPRDLMVDDQAVEGSVVQQEAGMLLSLYHHAQRH